LAYIFFGLKISPSIEKELNDIGVTYDGSYKESCPSNLYYKV